MSFQNIVYLHNAISSTVNENGYSMNNSKKKKQLKARDVSDKSEHTVCMIFFFYEKCIADKIANQC